MPGYDSWPSSTWKKIIEEQLEQVEQMPRADFDTMLKKQLPSGLIRESLFFSQQVAHYNAKYTES
ncbi:hypothetical protein [Paenibacillus amylolyticus]|uniref:hypothetical protein n=1 Tax=Paenibacillus amylolyticus TaxID=1451 RepID=UPI00197D265E|nr:hypothetical protein [Paenibacillus amylolyticus]